MFRSVPSRFLPSRTSLTGVAAAALVLALVSPLPADAQSNGRIEALNQKIDRLQGELNDLQRSVYQGQVETPVPKVEAAPSAGASGQGGAGLSRAAGQRLRERIETLEDDLRRVTGQLEETRHALRQATKRLDKLVTDVDFRLREMEAFRRETEARLKALDGGDGQDATAAATPGEDTESADGEPAGDGETSAGGDNADTVAGRQEKTLGQVSPEAVEAMREKAAEAEQAAPADAGDTAPETAGTAEAGTAADDGGDDGGDTTSGSAESKTQTASAEGTGGDAGDGVRAEYTEAFGLLRQRDYAEAEAALRAFVEAHPEHALAGNAKYWLGETFYVRENYEQAAVVFAEGFRTYPESRKAPDNLLKLGMSLARIDEVDKACQLFAELQKRFPDAAQNILQRASRERDRLQCGG